MESELRKKWSFSFMGRKLVLVKKREERTSHVLMKALFWSLYMDQYPHLMVEVNVGGRYKPDVVAVDDKGTPRFWGELGQVRKSKLRKVLQRYRNAHFAIGKWAMELGPLARLIEGLPDMASRSAPIDLISFPEDSAERFLNQRGVIRLCVHDLNWLRMDSDGRFRPYQHNGVTLHCGSREPHTLRG
ncbi:MAG: hypothetical protein QNJ22_15745 [Desulfosarcinaceae bacterium]|nr:hypothetical protein [Desulfosarcinaceae bacterium]